MSQHIFYVDIDKDITRVEHFIRFDRSAVKFPKEGPDYLLVEKDAGEGYIVNFQNETETIGFDTKDEAISSIIKYMLKYDS